MTEGVINIHGAEYTLIAKRIQDFREKYPTWSIRTKMLTVSERGVLFRARILDDTGRLVAEGHAQEKWSQKGINAVSAIENCETSSVGRALAFLGFGGHTMASAEEVANSVEQQKRIEANHRLMAHMNAVRDMFPSIHAIKAGIAEGDLQSAKEAWDELTEDEKRALWVAPTKGGIFTTEEREVIKSSEFRNARAA